MSAEALAERFELLGELGRGAMGVVYRAQERATGREVALKVLAPGERDPELVLRARREAEALGAVRHPGIVAVHAAGSDGGRPWLACELIEGARPLDRAWAGLERAARVRLVRDVARALGHAHARGVVHRDVKAANVLVGADGRPRVADFGLALLGGAERLTATGAVLGTPAAMAPEQVRGDRGAVGPPTDVWALGVLLYEALTGERPFRGQTVFDLGLKVLEAEPSAPRALDPTVPPALEAVALRALRKDPGARHADGDAFAAALEEALRAPAPRPLRSAPLLGAVALAAAGAGAAVLVRRATPEALAPAPAPPTSSVSPAPTAPAPAELDPLAGVDRAALEALAPDAEEAPVLALVKDDPTWRRLLGKAHLMGSRGVRLDPRRGQAWLRAAAVLDGDVPAMAELGQSLVAPARGQPRPSAAEEAEGVAWLRRAAEAGDRDGLFWLATRLEHRDPPAALRLAEGAIAGGRGGHTWRLVARLRRGAGDLRGTAAALEAVWGEEEALEDHADAVVELADLHLAGVAVVDTTTLRARLVAVRDARRDRVGADAAARLAELDAAAGGGR